MKLKTLFTSMAVMLASTTAHAETFDLVPGWNLLGTIASIPTSQILSNTNVKNVVIFKNGAYQATNKNEFNTIPSKSGFFVFSESSTTISFSTTDTSINLAKLDGNGNELADDAASWKILHIKDANLYVEMKNDFTVGQKFSINGVDFGEAAAYCSGLAVGNISGWRLPSIGELTGVGSVYRLSGQFFTTLSEGDKARYWSNTRADVNSNYTSYAVVRASASGRPEGYVSTKSGAGHVICVKDS